MRVQLTLDFLRRHAEQALSINVRLGRPPGWRLPPGEVLPPSLEGSPEEVRAASSGRPVDIRLTATWARSYGDGRLASAVVVAVVRAGGSSSGVVVGHVGEVKTVQGVAARHPTTVIRSLGRYGTGEELCLLPQSRLLSPMESRGRRWSGQGIVWVVAAAAAFCRCAGCCSTLRRRRRGGWMGCCEGPSRPSSPHHHHPLHSGDVGRRALLRREKASWKVRPLAKAWLASTPQLLRCFPSIRARFCDAGQRLAGRRSIDAQLCAR